MNDVRHLELGLIGLGQMGHGLGRNLAQRGFRVRGYDLRQQAIKSFVDAGGAAAADPSEVVRECPIVMTSLVSPAYLKLCRELLVPEATRGQIFIDWSTIPPPEARRVAGEFTAKGAMSLDAPVTGGREGAERAELRVFVGGPYEIFEQCRPIFEAVSRRDGVTYGGAAGQGQVLKVVQQLKHRITDAVRLEVIAFGMRAGLTTNQIRRALDVDAGSGDPYEQLIQLIECERGDELGCLNTEWSYYLQEAEARNIPMPALSAMYEFCRTGLPVYQDTQARRGASVWRELLSREG